MASDISLVLRGEHRHLLRLADRCDRRARGFQDPEGDLRRSLAAHLSAASAEVYPVVHADDTSPWPGGSVEELAAQLDEGLAGDELVDAARAVVELERSRVVPILDADLPLTERRRIGRVYRIRSESTLRAAAGDVRRSHRSQSELYELARRAGVEQRSRMTQVQLQAAVSAWEQARRRSDDPAEW